MKKLLLRPGWELVLPALMLSFLGWWSDWPESRIFELWVMIAFLEVYYKVAAIHRAVKAADDDEVLAATDAVLADEVLSARRRGHEQADSQ